MFTNGARVCTTSPAAILLCRLPVKLPFPVFRPPPSWKIGVDSNIGLF
jgi:hypothetical protein